MRKILPLLVTLFLLNFSAAFAQPERELRAVWLTSVHNIDWPHSTAVSATNQQNRLRNILNTLQETNINAVFFQVRPNADALYNSAYEPWSQWITGSRGQDPGYDPLAFVIQEAHKRGIEVHAWLNPYRFENTAGQYSNSPGNYSQTHPELIITHNNRTYFDPGNPATTELIKDIITDLLSKYPLDGIVFDDYFYPSGITLAADQNTFNSWGTMEFVGEWYNELTRGNFRRASVNNMIKEVFNTIKAIDPGVVFGVSPFGIYSTQASAATHWGTTLPGGITGWDAYNAIFCDPLAWLHDGTVDYISPQLYWQIGGAQDFSTLTMWWGNEAKRRGLHSYPSLGSYRLYESGYNWPVTEIENQIIANRHNPNNLAHGVVFYNTSGLINPSKNLAGHLAQTVFAEPSIFPELPWIAPIQPGAPQISEMGAVGEDLNVLAANIINSPTSKFLIYGWENAPSKDLPDNADYMQTIFGKDFSLFYPGNNQYFAVAEVMPNREIGNLSAVYSHEFLAPSTILTPAGNPTLCDMFTFSWSEVPQSIHYQLLISNRQNPSLVVYTSPQITATTYDLPSGILPGQQNYVFRVRATSPGGVSWSAPGSFFTGYPIATTLNAPGNGATNVNLTTTFQWNNVSGAQSYHLQVATDASFSSQSLVIDQQPINANILSVQLQQHNTQHFARVRVKDTCGYSAWSAVNSFTTAQGTSVDEIPVKVLQAFPNPAYDQCRVHYPSEIGERQIRWFGINGQLVFQEQRKDIATHDLFDISHLPAGFYTVQILTRHNQTFVMKVLKTQ